jgi:hypothetical protein
VRGYFNIDVWPMLVGDSIFQEVYARVHG